MDLNTILARYRYHYLSAAGASILKVTYGYTVQEEKDPFIELAEKVMAVFSRLVTPGAYLVDLIPAREAKLKHLLSEHIFK